MIDWDDQLGRILLEAWRILDQSVELCSLIGERNDQVMIQTFALDVLSINIVRIVIGFASGISSVLVPIY